jgi:hypothetical protein
MTTDVGLVHVGSVVPLVTENSLLKVVLPHVSHR